MQAEQQSEVLPCPFCGAVGLDFAEGSTFRWIVASCTGCGASTGETRIQTLGQGTKEEWMAEAQQDAIAAWNTRAALSHPSTAQGWQPIESAPKDGTTILLAGKKNRMADGEWLGVARAWNWPYVNAEPTRWMPLPPPPEQGGKG